MLPALKQLLLSNTFPMAEIALLAGRRPDIHCDLFQPCSEVVSWTKCKKCQNATMVMLTGKGTPWLCTSCDWARISRHQDEFPHHVLRERLLDRDMTIEVSDSAKAEWCRAAAIVLSDVDMV